MAKIDCENCGMEIPLYRYKEYIGEVKCSSCESISKVRIMDGKLIDKKMEYGKN